MGYSYQLLLKIKLKKLLQSVKHTCEGTKFNGGLQS